MGEPLTDQELEKLAATRDGRLIKGIIAAIVPYIHALERHVAELESNTLKYCGVYQPSVSYQRGSVVTHDGSAFHATRAVTAEKPGTSDGWQLMIKHGKDAPMPRSDTSTASQRVMNGTQARPRP